MSSGIVRWRAKKEGEEIVTVIPDVLWRLSLPIFQVNTPGTYRFRYKIEYEVEKVEEG